MKPNIIKAEELWTVLYLCFLLAEKGKIKPHIDKHTVWVNLWLGIIALMTKPAWWWAGKRIYKAQEDLKYVHKHATLRAPTQSFPYLTRTHENALKSTSAHKSSHGLQPGPSLDHAPHPHPLSKKPEVNSFPYSLSLSHHAPSHKLTAPITASGASSFQTLNFLPNAPISVFP